MIQVIINVNTCLECPYCIRKENIFAGYAFDFFCGSNDMKPIATYVEYKNEFPNEPPKWCPYRKDGDE